MSHFQILAWSVGYFVRTLPLALGLATACLLAQITFWVAFGGFGETVGFVGGLLFVFAHAWLVLFLAGWNVRQMLEGITPSALARRAFAWALLATGLFGVLMAFAPIVGDLAHGFGLPDISIPGRLLAAGGLVTWALIAGSGLPARLMSGVRTPPIRAWGDWGVAIVLAVAPWMAALWIFSWPVRTCRGECYGMFEGGLVTWPLLAGLLFALSVGLAAISAAVQRARLSGIDP